ncbi:hypothetical protein BV898_05303 [Hypsibius exemplaris]|uniref:SBF1/SBF2 domain-containing protein n=1 Tax=Hypsibius exemplaris TaxID=2072580 RepID=A0A1W0WZT5_HYPEX|nr:hypothetical protein BV898_05303 [Hypsibius exemplaris]
MTFFLMKNRFQQQKEEETTTASTTQQQQPSPRPGRNFLNALFGSSSAGGPTDAPGAAATQRKTSQSKSDASSPSRASSTSGRSHAYPPRRISFDEVDYGPTRENVRGRQPSQNQQGDPNSSRNATTAGFTDNNRPDDHSSGTTDPPDEDPDVDFAGETDDNHAGAGRGEFDRGSDSSGPDSPQEAAPGMDDDLVLFMRQFVEQIFLNSQPIGQEEKSQFGELARLESGRLWFARFINSQRINYSSKVDDGTFYRLVQYIAIVLFECYQEEDYGPAKILMNICFTFYKEVPSGASRRIRREFLYHHLRKQAIWHSLKFWNAAYFDAMQADRARRSHRERSDNDNNSSNQGNTQQSRPQSGTTEEDYVCRTLVDFITNMRAFHVARDSVIEFIRKQSQNVNPDQFRSLREQVDAMYA